MYKRQAYIDKLKSFRDKDFIKVLTGVRRCGKSVILKQYMDYLKDDGVKENHIIYINLESYENQFIKGEQEFSDLIYKMLPKDSGKVYLLVDEIQFIDGWQRVINSFRVSFDCDIVITGSNAKLLSGELATLLSGRYVEIVIYPFSFKEFLNAKNIDINDRIVDIAYKEYEKYGGFPGVLLSDEVIKPTILSGIYDSIILNDIAARGFVKDTLSLKKVVSFLSDNVGQLVNPSKISNLLKSENLNISNHTVNKYLELLQEAYLFFEVRPYDIRGKAYLKQNSKYFMVDNGLRNQSVGFKESNQGNRLENIVFIELKRRGYEVAVANIDNKEIDFIARKNDLVKYFQVTYQIPENTHETDNLLLIKDNFEKTVITGRYEGVNNIAGIKVEYVVDWLVKEEENL
ncbi:ATP-binding protein [Criibacterium bergeronii]|uniref:ATP-binding protein n=1 Tax=Criibacterium bergeronii TaxID=1871336 RepID=A0A371IK23_9FIRM|nr:ATP-binding protein [Criibacterium bergeronii]RDY20813.1 ATP-binding protein [Criibacterium bergeronii]